MLLRLYQEKKEIEPVVIDHVTMLLSNTPIVEDGKIEEVSRFSPSSVSETFAGFKASDFSISCLRSMDMLRKQYPVSFSNGNYTSISNQLENMVKYVETTDK